MCSICDSVSSHCCSYSFGSVLRFCARVVLPLPSVRLRRFGLRPAPPLSGSWYAVRCLALLVSGPRLLPSALPLRVDRFPVVGPAIAGRCRSGVALIIAAVEGLPSGFGAQEGRQLSKAVCPGVAWRRFFTFWIFSRCIACASHALSSCQLDVGNSFCRWRGFSCQHDYFSRVVGLPCLHIQRRDYISPV